MSDTMELDAHNLLRRHRLCSGLVGDVAVPDSFVPLPNSSIALMSQLYLRSDGGVPLPVRGVAVIRHLITHSDSAVSLLDGGVALRDRRLAVAQRGITGADGVLVVLVGPLSVSDGITRHHHRLLMSAPCLIPLFTKLGDLFLHRLAPLRQRLMFRGKRPMPSLLGL